MAGGLQKTVGAETGFFHGVITQNELCSASHGFKENGRDIQEVFAFPPNLRAFVHRDSSWFNFLSTPAPVSSFLLLAVF